MIKDNQIIFREVQHFRQKWIWAILLIATVGPGLVITYGAFKQLVYNVPMGNHPASNGTVILTTLMFWLIMLGLLGLFAFSRLITEVRSDGLYVRFIPFHFRYQKIKFDEVQSYEARTYHPIGEYGGWGIRYGVRGKAYNVSGNRGVEFTYRNGKHLLIGSQQADELAKAIGQLSSVKTT